MADNTIIQQGKFTSDGADKVIKLRNGVDWMEVYNYTQLGDTNDVAVQFYWQRGMADGTGIVYNGVDGDGHLATDTLDEGGFTFIDTSSNPVGVLNNTVTAVSNVTPPVVTCTLAVGELIAGEVVRMIDITGASQIGGLDFTVGAVTATGAPGSHFTLAYMVASGAGTAGGFRKIIFEPQFYPRHRYISNITQAVEAVITLTVTHGYTIGQQIRILVPSEFDMTEINGKSATIVDIDTATNTITVNIDSTGFTAFDFPADAATPFTPAMIVPIGEVANAAIADPNDLDDATRNTGFIGMSLGGGDEGPAGADADVIYWRAGSSFSVDNV